MDDDWLDGSLHDLARTQHGAFSHEQAAGLGFTDHQIDYRVRTKRWVVTSKGVYRLPGWTRSFRQRVMVGSLHLGEEAFASHRCGAMIRRLDGIGLAGLEFTVGRKTRARLKKATVHVTSTACTDDWSLVDGIPTATATRIVVDLAMQGSSFDVVERVFECGQRRGETSHEEVRGLLARVSKPGVRGVGRARSFAAMLLDDGRVNHSELETRFFQLLRNAGLPLPVRQSVVLRPDGRLAYADYAYEGVDGIIELLGFRWHSSSSALTRDVERSNDVQLQRKTVLQFTWEHVTKRQRHVIEKVEALLCIAGRQESGRNAQE